MNNYTEFVKRAELLKALAHPVRLCIVRGLINSTGCNVGYIQNCLDMPQSTVSQHLQKLRVAGIIKGERTGLEIKYSICEPIVGEIIKLLFTADEGAIL